MRPEGPVRNRQANELTSQEPPSSTPARIAGIIAPTERNLRKRAKSLNLLVPSRDEIEVHPLRKGKSINVLVWELEKKPRPQSTSGANS